MAFAKSLHKQYLGTEAGMGLKHGFTLLERKGLDQASTKGLFHDNLERALYHILEAHIRDCWTMVGSVAQLQDLRQALMVMEDAGQADELKTQATMFMRDMLQYVVLDQAIKYGDIGLMEAMLPHLLVRFVGGRNSHYATECLELLQGLHREWPPAVSDFVRKHCWLVNFSGKRDTHGSIDRAQE